MTFVCRFFDDYDTSNCALRLLLDGKLLVKLVGWITEEGVGEIVLGFEFLV